MRLFRPAWDSKNEKRAVKAIKKLTDQNVLVDVAKNAKYSIVRVAAVKKITDQIVLADIAKYDNDREVCIAAAVKITDEILLSNLIQFLGNELKTNFSEEIAELLLEMYRKRKDAKQIDFIAAYNGTKVIRRKHRDSSIHSDGEDPLTCSSLSGMGGCNHSDGYVHSDNMETYQSAFNTEDA